MKQYQMFINNEWCKSSTGETMEVLNPATEEVIATVPRASNEDVDKAVAAAKSAFPAWNAMKVEERAKYVQQLAEKMEQNKEKFADLIVKELGAAKEFTMDYQVANPPKEMKAALKEAEDYPWEEDVDGATVIREGSGVVAAITPWNYPLNQIQRKLTPALITGNTLVVKPASNTPLTALYLAELIEEVNLPAGVVNIITGGGSDAGDYLAAHSDVAVISFTGSTEVGKGLYEKAGQSVKKLVLELGGKSALVYLKGGDLELAVKQSMNTIFNNSGQTCSALTRLLVPEDEIDEVKEKIKQHYDDFVKVGNPADPNVTVGPMVSQDQKETVLNYIEKGKKEGAEILIGGNKIEGKGFFVEPTIFVNVDNKMIIAQEEIFGPVLTVLTYKDKEEAIEIANDSVYGLSGAVVGPKKEAEEVARRLRTGNVIVNNGPRTPHAPFGGYKQSGIGRENGKFGLDDYVEIKAIFIDKD